MSAWPISLITTASDTPPASRSVAAPCRSPWKVIPPNPCVAADLRQPVENDAGSQGPPDPVVDDELRLQSDREQPLGLTRGGAGVPSSRRPGSARSRREVRDRRRGAIRACGLNRSFPALQVRGCDLGPRG